MSLISRNKNSFRSHIDETRRNAVLDEISFSGRNKYIVIGIVALITLVLFVSFQGIWTLLNSSADFEVVGNGDSSTNKESTVLSDSSSQTESQQSKQIYVHVLGAVNNPGMFCLPESSRLNDAITAAGGLSSEADERSVNLARVLDDGEQITVLTQEQYEAQNASGATNSTSSTASSSTSNTGTSSNSSTLVNINSATQEQLETLPGIGEATAKKIIADRNSNGAFSAISDITRVSGIGDKKFEAIKDLITV